MKKQFKILVWMVLPTIIPFLGSCNDTWADHYDAEGQLSEETLWDAIYSNDDLKEFAAILEQTGYDKYLSEDQTYTVWAPQGAIDTLLVSGASMTEDELLTQVVKNHIARSAISVSASKNDTITALNGKQMALNYNSFNGVNLVTKNIVCRNGILHIIEQQSEYNNNIWSYINQDDELDSLSNYLYSFTLEEFDAESSTQSGVKNGQKIYSDSVFVTTNEMWTKLGYMNSDSYNYWMLAPTDEAWNTAFETYGQYYNYPSGTDESYHDSYTKLAIVDNIMYQTDEQISPVDSLTSTTGFVFHSPFATDGIFSYVTDTVNCSNGTIYKTSKLSFSPEKTFMSTIVIEAENSDYVLEKNNCSEDDAVVLVTAAKTGLSNSRYMQFTPSGSKLKPNVTFALPNTLSGTYDIGVVFVPLNLTRNGWSSSIDQMPAKVALELTDENDDTNNGYVEVNPALVAADKIDTVWVAQGHTFPYCDYFPDNEPSQSKVSIYVASVVKPSETSTYTRTMYIDCIVLKPSTK